jgi:hypothetical protein
VVDSLGKRTYGEQRPRWRQTESEVQSSYGDRGELGGRVGYHRRLYSTAMQLHFVLLA